MHLSQAIKNLPCRLACGQQGQIAEGEETIRICQDRCERWRAVAAAIETAMHPSLPFEQLAHKAYAGGAGAVDACFLDCSRVDTNGFVKAIPPECYPSCGRWQAARRAALLLRAELEFAQLKDYIVELTLATGADVADAMFVRLFPDPGQQGDGEEARLVIPPAASAEDTASRGLYFRSCRLNRWMVNIRFVLGGAIAASALLMQHLLRLDFPYAGLYAVSISTLLCNVAFWWRLRGHAARKLKGGDRCPVCTQGFTEAQIAADFVLLGAIIALTGGIFSPIALFFFPHVIFSTLLQAPRVSRANTALATVIYGVALAAQQRGVLPESVLASAAGAYVADPAIPFLFWAGFTFYAAILHYFTLQAGRELSGWQKEFLALGAVLRERSEIAGKLNDRLTRIDAIRRRMVNVASHDLKSPLSAIEGHLKVLLGGYHGPLDARQVEVMERMLVRMQGMREFINEILDVATLEKEGLRRELQAIDAGPLIRQVEDDSSWLAKDKKVDLAFRRPGDLPSILAVPHRFVQVLQNLVTNAIKFTPAGGVVTVAIEPRAGDVHFAVRDTGTGISKEDVRHVFTEFYRVKNVTQDGVPGSGLGLSIVKAIINAHGGAVWVESEVGRGSTFHFTVKRAPADTAATPPVTT